MTVEMANWVTALFFLFALILVYRFRVPISAESRKSYSEIAGGLAVLALVSVGRVYHGIGTFAIVPFLSEPLFYDLASWIGIITGAALVITGVADWLPLARNHRRYNRTRIRHLDLLRKVEQLVRVETRLDSILSLTVNNFVEHFDFTHGVVFKYSSRHGKLSLTAVSNSSPLSYEQMERITVDSKKLSLYTNGGQGSLTNAFAWFPEETSRPSTVLPIMVEGKPVGFFMLWSDDQTNCDRDDELTIRLAVDVIVSKIESDRLSLRNVWLDEYRAWFGRIQDKVADAQTLKDRFSLIAKGVAEMMPVDYCALSIVDRTTDRMRRLSSGTSGQVLLESGLPIPDHGSLTAPAFLDGEQVTFSNLNQDEQPSTGEIVTGQDVSSLVAMPISIDGTMAGVMTLASRKPAAFRWRELECLNSIRPLLSQILLREVTQMDLRHMEQLLNSVAGFGARVAGIETIGHTLGAAANMIAEELKPDMVRASVVENGGNFLRSRALLSTFEGEIVVPGDGQMITSLMPLHEQALITAQPVLVTMDNPTMTEIEAKQAFAAGVKSALIVPMLWNRRVVGLISLAYFHEPELPMDSQTAIGLVRALAQMATMAMRAIPAGMTPGVVPRATMLTANDSLRSRLRSPLTGILGSVEMLKSHEEGVDDDKLKRFLSIIDRSAQKIDQYLKEPVLKEPVSTE